MPHNLTTMASNVVILTSMKTQEITLEIYIVNKKKKLREASSENGSMGGGQS